MQRKADKIGHYFYINLIEDHEGIGGKFFIHEKSCTFINIPPHADLKNFKDERFNSILNYSKIYFAAHGNHEVNDAVTSSTKENSTIYHLKDVTQLFAKLLNHDRYKDPNYTPRLKIVLSVCEGLNFAKELQKKLYKEHGIYIDVIANKHLVYEKFTKSTNKLNILQRVSSVRPGADKLHHMPNSKVLILIDATGKQKEIDAYELKWLENVLTTINQKYLNFKKWADATKNENNLLNAELKNLLSVVALIVETGLTKDVHQAFNEMKLFLTRLNNDEIKNFTLLTKHDYICHELKQLKQEGDRLASSNITNEFLKDDKKSSKEDKHGYVESAQALINAAKVKYSDLLLEASQTSTEMHADIQDAANVVDALRSNFNMESKKR